MDGVDELDVGEGSAKWGIEGMPDAGCWMRSLAGDVGSVVSELGVEGELPGIGVSRKMGVITSD